jgi:hypothetical protein
LNLVVRSNASISINQYKTTKADMSEGMEQWDLTAKVSPYLDRHMMFPLLEYMDGLINAGTVSYSTQDVAAARLALLRPTHMVDYAIDIYKGLHGTESEVPKEMEEQKTSVYQRLEELEKGCKALHELCGKGDEKVRKGGYQDDRVASAVFSIHTSDCPFFLSYLSLVTGKVAFQR